MDQPRFRKVRVYFRKVGDVRFLSHLDVMRTMDRALRRAGLPVRYTEGMNPKVKLNFPTALPLGMESLSEAMEIQVADDVSVREVCERLSAELPEGLRVFDGDSLFPGEKWRVRELHYRIDGPGDLPSGEEIRAHLSRERIPAQRRKREVDLKPLIRELAREEDAVRLSIAWTDAGTARPEDVLRSLGREPGEFRVVKLGTTFESSLGEIIRKCDGT